MLFVHDGCTTSIALGWRGLVMSTLIIDEWGVDVHQPT